jgi:hypothetical protein
LSSFCGVEIAINDEGIELSMNYYWLKLMKRFGIGADGKEDRPIKKKSIEMTVQKNQTRNAKRLIFKLSDR